MWPNMKINKWTFETSKWNILGLSFLPQRRLFGQFLNIFYTRLICIAEKLLVSPGGVNRAALLPISRWCSNVWHILNLQRNAQPLPQASISQGMKDSQTRKMESVQWREYSHLHLLNYWRPCISCLARRHPRLFPHSPIACSPPSSDHFRKLFQIISYLQRIMFFFNLIENAYLLSF